MAARILQVELPEETAALLEKWSRDTGLDISQLLAKALTLLKYAIDSDVTLVKKEKGAEEELKVSSRA